jgi:hypothetical protein
LKAAAHGADPFFALGITAFGDAIRECAANQPADAEHLLIPASATQARNPLRQHAGGICLCSAFTHEEFKACLNILTLPAKTAFLQ